MSRETLESLLRIHLRHRSLPEARVMSHKAIQALRKHRHDVWVTAHKES